MAEELTPAARRAAERTAKLEQRDREITALEAALAAIAAWHEADAAASPDTVALDEAADTAVDSLAVVFGASLSDARRESMRMAIEAGAPIDTLHAIASAVRIARKGEITLPQGEYASLSRGSSWCRRSDGVFADRSAHKVGPGKWVVGSSDGFRRSSRTTWTVEHVQVGAQTWTIASS